MSGGIAWIYDVDGTFADNCNPEMVDLDPLSTADEEQINALLRTHIQLTQSQLAQNLLNNWGDVRSKFIKVFPKEYKKVLQHAQFQQVN
jgi:glutamate synthase (NADPH/NADH) large chain